MTEALKAVLDFCFTQAGFQKVKARYASLNLASGRVMEKAGMFLSKDCSKWGREKRLYCGPYLLSDERRRQISLKFIAYPLFLFFIYYFIYPLFFRINR